MADRPGPNAETRDGVAGTVYLWLLMGFMLGLIGELAVLGFDRLMNVSLVAIFAIPVSAGAAGMGIIWAVNRRFGPPGIVLANWSAGGMYLAMFAADLVLRLFALWLYTMPIILAGMVVGSIIGLRLGIARVRAGDLSLFKP